MPNGAFGVNLVFTLDELREIHRWYLLAILDQPALSNDADNTWKTLAGMLTDKELQYVTCH